MFNFYKQDIPVSGGDKGNRNEKEVMYSKARFVLNHQVRQFITNIGNNNKIKTCYSEIQFAAKPNPFIFIVSACIPTNRKRKPFCSLQIKWQFLTMDLGMKLLLVGEHAKLLIYYPRNTTY
jgi:hypothetical protein